MTSEQAREFPAALADMPVAEWAAAVSARHSSRAFDGSPVAASALARLQRLCAELPAPDVARVVVVPQAPEDIFTGVVGSYGRIKGAPSALLIIGTEGAAEVNEGAGYLGEAVILEATSLGLATLQTSTLSSANASYILPTFIYLGSFIPCKVVIKQGILAFIT